MNLKPTRSVAGILSIVRKVAFVSILVVIATSGPIVGAEDENCYNGPCSSCETEPGKCWSPQNQNCWILYPGECDFADPSWTFCSGLKRVCECELGSCGGG